MAGFGPLDPTTNFTEEEGALLLECVNADPEYRFCAEFLGQSDNGRWIVNLIGKDDKENLLPLLLESQLGAAREDKISKTFEQVCASDTQATVKEATVAATKVVDMSPKKPEKVNFLLIVYPCTYVLSSVLIALEGSCTCSQTN